MPAARQEQLPGADPDPCCMGTAAQAVVDVVAGFVEEELADRRYLLAMSRQAPAWARQRLRDMAVLGRKRGGQDDITALAVRPPGGYENA